MSRSLPARIAVSYALLITIVLSGFAAAVYVFAVVEPDELEDPVGVVAPEGAELELARNRLLETLAITLPMAVLIALVGGVWLTRRSLAPLEQIVALCRALRLSDLTTRIARPAGTTAEIDDLAVSMNAMLERLERSVDGLRRFTGDASHELRTPLTRVQGELELALRNAQMPRATADAIAASLEEVAGMTRLVEALLKLARADAGELVQSHEAVELSALVQDVAAPYEEVALERGLALSVRVTGTCIVNGDNECLRRAVSNLVDNACKFTQRGGSITVDVSGANGRALVTVADTGPAIPADDVVNLFQRFHRSEQTRAVPGVGLGLALCRDIVRAHGGDVVLLRNDAAGPSFVIDLPAQPSPA